MCLSKYGGTLGSLARRNSTLAFATMMSRTIAGPVGTLTQKTWASATPFALALAVSFSFGLSFALERTSFLAARLTTTIIHVHHLVAFRDRKVTTRSVHVFHELSGLGPSASAHAGRGVCGCNRFLDCPKFVHISLVCFDRLIQQSRNGFRESIIGGAIIVGLIVVFILLGFIRMEFVFIFLCVVPTRAIAPWFR